MALSTKVVFPAPPPTTNTLTPQQRTQLMRSTRKLGRIFGTTPHLIDTSNSNASAPLHIHLPFDSNETHPYSCRASVDSFSSSSSSLRSLERSSSTHSTLSRSSGSLRSKNPPSKKLSDSFDSWPSQKPPMQLRLAVSSPLETIPASPTTSSPPPDAPSFALPSLNTERRRKMDRIRKKLGDGVPLRLIFPTQDEGDSEADNDNNNNNNHFIPSPSPLSSSSSSLSPLDEKNENETSFNPQGPLAARRLTGKTRIVYTRDSIADLSPHRAPRALNAPNASRLAPSPPPPPSKLSKPRHRRASSSSSSSSSFSLRGKERLCVIMESPNEHGSVGCRVPDAGSAAAKAAQWYGSDDEFQFQVQLWSTRGYGGWREDGGVAFRQRGIEVPVC